LAFAVLWPPLLDRLEFVAGGKRRYLLSDVAPEFHQSNRSIGIDFACIASIASVLLRSCDNRRWRNSRRPSCGCLCRMKSSTLCSCIPSPAPDAYPAIQRYNCFMRSVGVATFKRDRSLRTMWQAFRASSFAHQQLVAIGTGVVRDLPGQKAQTPESFSKISL
jgi:hypothetical protein